MTTHLDRPSEGDTNSPIAQSPSSNSRPAWDEIDLYKAERLAAEAALNAYMSSTAPDLPALLWYREAGAPASLVGLVYVDCDTAAVLAAWREALGFTEPVRPGRGTLEVHGDTVLGRIRLWGTVVDGEAGEHPGEYVTRRQ